MCVSSEDDGVIAGVLCEAIYRATDGMLRRFASRNDWWAVSGVTFRRICRLKHVLPKVAGGEQGGP